jgi:hypothetical protein
LLEQLRIDCAWQMRPGWGGSTDGADGIQYHYVVSADGIVYQCRDAHASLWHCGHAIGNTRSLSIHLPLGGDQDATSAQWNATTDLFQMLCHEYHIVKTNVVGHCEWGGSACPGPHLMTRLRAWRAVPSLIPPTEHDAIRMRVRQGLHATVRQGPGRTFPIAGSFRPGTTFYMDKIVPGERVLDDARWAHMARIADVQADLGFIHLSALEPAAA